jgi:hypothetical protein
MQDILNQMLDSDQSLYERVLSTPGFSYHFNRLCLLAASAELVGAVEGYGYGSTAIEEILVVCKKHGISISHEDDHGGFVIEPWSEENADWLRQADDRTKRNRRIAQEEEDGR